MSQAEHEVLKDCGCWACIEGRGESVMTMVLCPQCGNKRCPRAASHYLGCTNSNAPGQVGSAYEEGSGAASARRFNADWNLDTNPEYTRHEVRIAVDWRTGLYGDPEPEDLWIEAAHVLQRELAHGFKVDPKPEVLGEVLRTPAPVIDVEKLQSIVVALRSSDDVDQHDIADSIEEAMGQTSSSSLPDEFLNRDAAPSKDGLAPGQVWVWMRGATPPHWQVRGTGAFIEENDITGEQA